MGFTLTPVDQKFFEKYLHDFLPEKVYDMHVHLWNHKGQKELGSQTNPLRMDAGFEEMERWHHDLFPGREWHYLFLGTPEKEIHVARHNDFLAEELRKDPLSMAGCLVTPEETPAYLAECFEKKGFDAVKPYRVYTADPAEARITEYLPEPLIEVIDHYKKAVTLHLSMKDGVAPPENLEDLAYLTRRYPHVKWILAHCARAFNANFLEKSIHFLKELPNIYYDTSAVNDLYSHCLLLKYENIDRIMFGSDGIVAGGMHGKYITYADAWQYYPGAGVLEHCRADAVPVVYEQLLQQKRAAELLELSNSDICKIFRDNAGSFIKSLKNSGADNGK